MEILLQILLKYGCRNITCKCTAEFKIHVLIPKPIKTYLNKFDRNYQPSING